MKFLKGNINEAISEPRELAYNLMQTPAQSFTEYIYRGKFTDELTFNLMNLLDSKFSNEKVYDSFKKLIYYTLIESLQNLIRHGEKPPKLQPELEDILCVQTLSFPQKEASINTGNLIKNEHIPSLKKKLDHIQALDNEEIKKEYRNILMNGRISEKGGAGLGLISMAMRTQNAISYYFEPINEKYSYYYFQAVIKKPESQVSEAFSLKRLANLHQMLNRKNILLKFNGSFFFDRTDYLQPIVNWMKIGKRNVNEKVFFIMTRMLHNIFAFGKNYAKGHNYKKQSFSNIILVGQSKSAVFVTGGNLLPKNEVDKLKVKIDTINNMSREGLQDIEKYLNNLYAKEIECVPDSALISMKMKGNCKIEYDFKPATKELSYFTVLLKIPPEGQE